MSRLVFSALAASVVAGSTALPTSALAYCNGCYTPCTTCYRQVVAPPQYRTVMVEPERVYAQRVPAQYATVSRVEMVAPPRAYWVPSRPACPTCY